jgi:hypothetical protein
MEHDFALRYVRIYPGVNGRAELVTLASGMISADSIQVAPKQREKVDYKREI